MANFGMENLHSDGFHTEEASTNCDLKQVSSNELPGRDSAATTKPVFFPFPFPPYDIQEDFMRTLFQVLDNGEVGIFESPTGTGKSLSLICGTLTWLKCYEERQQEELENALSSSKQLNDQRNSGREEKGVDLSSTPDWVAEFAEKQAKRETEDRLKEERERLEKQKAQLQKLKSEMRPAFAIKGKRKHSDDKSSGSHGDEDTEHRIADEIDEVLGKTCEKDPDADIVLTEYLSEGEEASSDQEEDDKEEEPHCLKIFYCSRTHSQLAQFVREVQKSPFNDSTRVVSLGSRQNLCINEDVKRLKNINKINDRCLELQKKDKDKKKPDGENAPKKKKIAKGCPFYSYQQLQKFSDHVLVDIKDIEQLVSVGEELHACPYYGTRLAIPPAQLVVLPYNILLHKSTREACGIKLDGNVVIIDEAHNLIDTISSIYSVEITGSQISCAHSQLTQYQERYRTRLKAKNLLYIQQLLYILSCFLNCLNGKEHSSSRAIPPSAAAEQGVLTSNEARMQDVKLKTINDFLFHAQMDNVNLFKIKKYCERSMISKKLNGFIDRYHSTQVETGSAEDDTYQSSSSPLQIIESFLEALTNADKDGRIVVNKQGRHSSSTLKFLLLNPAVHFTSIVKEARAVVVAGGTMQPISDFKDQLFTCAGFPCENIVEFSCGHVIPAEHLLSVALDKGPAGKELDFTYQSRDSTELKEELGRLLINISAVVPGGLVCFFSSYDYEQQVYTHWQKSGILDKMNARKKVFREPRKASQLDQVLSSYAACIKRSSVTSTSPNGAMLFCVVGGKMSEGINFSDDLGRCVVMVGLPYPNIYSPELKEKMTYLDATLGPKAGQAHYENLCMKAVNQSIGRAIRHRGDYATILLLDQRYGSARIQKNLPGWISNRLQHHTRFGSAFATVRKKEELGRLLINISAVVPGGLVCFFSSYDYEQQVYTHWQKSGSLDKLNARKKVFREPRKASQLDQVLSSYAACIKRSSVTSASPNGAMLFCVVRGKMSIRLNFSDDLGRCVVMVGLPYPNIYSPELKEKMTYLDATLGPKAGQAHYKNLCMKAVNQSIGRAIRHRGDYATILLLDQRYGSARIQKNLPGWISNSLQHHTRFGSAFATVRKFFVDKRQSSGTRGQAAQAHS